MAKFHRPSHEVLKPAGDWSIAMSAGSMSALDHAIGMFLNPGEAWRKTWGCRHAWWNLKPSAATWGVGSLGVQRSGYHLDGRATCRTLNGRPLGATCAIVYSNARLLDCSAICLYFELSFDSGGVYAFSLQLADSLSFTDLGFQKSLTLRCSRTNNWAY